MKKKNKITRWLATRFVGVKLIYFCLVSVALVSIISESTSYLLFHHLAPDNFFYEFFLVGIGVVGSILLLRYALIRRVLKLTDVEDGWVLFVAYGLGIFSENKKKALRERMLSLANIVLDTRWTKPDSKKIASAIALKMYVYAVQYYEKFKKYPALDTMLASPEGKEIISFLDITLDTYFDDVKDIGEFTEKKGKVFGFFSWGKLFPVLEYGGKCLFLKNFLAKVEEKGTIHLRKMIHPILNAEYKRIANDSGLTDKQKTSFFAGLAGVAMGYRATAFANFLARIVVEKIITGPAKEQKRLEEFFLNVQVYGV